RIPDIAQGLVPERGFPARHLGEPAHVTTRLVAVEDYDRLGVVAEFVEDQGRVRSEHDLIAAVRHATKIVDHFRDSTRMNSPFRLFNGNQGWLAGLGVQRGGDSYKQH